MQDQFLDAFFQSILASDFYLTGGTALARFYFHHRESVDLDLFSNMRAVDFDVVRKTVGKIGSDLGWKLLGQRTADDFLESVYQDKNTMVLKVDIVRDIPVRFGEIRKEQRIRIDSMENIGSNKVTAIYGRTVAKDFIDLYWIIHQGRHTFDALYALAQKKDLGVVDLYYAYALQKIQSVTTFPVMLKPYDWKIIVRYFMDISTMLFKRAKPPGA